MEGLLPYSSSSLPRPHRPRLRSNSTPPVFNHRTPSPASSTEEINAHTTHARGSYSYVTNQLTLERMLNPSVFFNSLRETKRKKGTPLHTGGGSGGKGGCLRAGPMMSLHQVICSFSSILVIIELV